MNWDDEKSNLGRQVRDNKGNLIGWIKRDPLTGHSHVSDQQGTVGWTKPHDKSGPGWSVLSKGGRVAHTDSPEYMLALHRQRQEEEKKAREAKHNAAHPSQSLWKKHTDGSDPNYR